MSTGIEQRAGDDQDRISWHWRAGLFDQHIEEHYDGAVCFDELKYGLHHDGMGVTITGWEGFSPSSVTEVSVLSRIRPEAGSDARLWVFLLVVCALMFNSPIRYQNHD